VYHAFTNGTIFSDVTYINFKDNFGHSRTIQLNCSIVIDCLTALLQLILLQRSDHFHQGQYFDFVKASSMMKCYESV
jgi:hypothetical protein